jgi:hypothetical protein
MLNLVVRLITTVFKGLIRMIQFLFRSAHAVEIIDYLVENLKNDIQWVS